LGSLDFKPIFYKSMPQEKAWNDEYKKPKLLSVKNSPQRDVVRFTRWVRKRGFKFKDSKLVDLVFLSQTRKVLN
jgi:hypothetical protein